MFFKAFQSKNQKFFGDGAWISHNGKVLILIDAASFTTNPNETLKFAISFLNLHELTIEDYSSQEILQKLNSHLCKGHTDYFASICVVKNNGANIDYSWLGNPQFVKLNENNSSWIIQPMHQPEMLAGMSKDINITSISEEVESKTVYILATDGLDLSSLHRYADILNLKTDRDWDNFASQHKKEDDWCFSVFPFERQISYQKYNWKYNPFIGPQEEYEHEKEGLCDIADALFLDDDFYGFKIVGGINIALKNSFRRMDGVLVSPYGVVLLELKHLYGNIILPLGGNQQMTAEYNGNKISDSSPVRKMTEALPAFSAWNALKSIKQTEARNIGAIIFTHPNAVVKCINQDGSISDEDKTGNILVSNSKLFPLKLKAYSQANLGKKYKLSQEQINEVCQELHNSNYLAASDNNVILDGKYSIAKDSLLENESTLYYKTYEGLFVRKNKKVWIKEYELTSIAKGSIEDEEKRIGREADALFDLSKSEFIQDYYDKIRIDTKFYIVLEAVDGVMLEQWVKEEHTLLDKLELLFKISKIILLLKNENIVHRAINPKNLRVLSNGMPILINFELCKLDFLPTLPPQGRRLFDSSYEAREVNRVSSANITTSSDAYSLGKIICFVLTGKIPFSNMQEKMIFVKQKNCWELLAEDCGIPSSAAENLKALLNDDPTLRPNVETVIDAIEHWIKMAK